MCWFIHGNVETPTGNSMVLMVLSWHCTAKCFKPTTTLVHNFRWAWHTHLTLTGLEGHICPSLVKGLEGHTCPTIVTSWWHHCDLI